MNKDLVTCIIPTYKRSDTLQRAIKSILNQTYKNLEVIVVDDNEPNDKYSKRVQERLNLINDNRLKYVQQKRHINGAVARNVGIREASGNFIAFLDDDDEWLPNKLEIQLEVLKNNLDYGGVSSLYTYYSNGIPIRKCPPYTSDNLHKKVLDRSVSVFTSTVVFRKEALIKSGVFDETMLRHQDLQLLLDFLYENKMMVLDRYCVKIHTDVGGNRPSTKKFEEIKSHFFNKMNRHFNKYSKRDQRRIYAAHYFEIILIALREKKVRTVFYYLLKIGFNPMAYKDMFKRYRSRKKYKV